jgi:hypothetical protein
MAPAVIQNITRGGCCRSKMTSSRCVNSGKFGTLQCGACVSVDRQTFFVRSTERRIKTRFGTVPVRFRRILGGKLPTQMHAFDCLVSKKGMTRATLKRAVNDVTVLETAAVLKG